MDNPTVEAVDSSTAATAAAVLAGAFADDPIFNYILGDRSDSETQLGYLFGESVRAELRKSAHLVEMTQAGNAVALWYDVDDWKTPPMELVRLLPSAVRAFGKRLPRHCESFSAPKRCTRPSPIATWPTSEPTTTTRARVSQAYFSSR